MPLWKTTVSVSLDLVVASDDKPTHFDLKTAAEEEIADNGLRNVTYGPASRIVGPGDIPGGWENSGARGGTGEACTNVLFTEALARLEANLPDPRQARLFTAKPPSPDEIEQIERYQRLLEPLRGSDWEKGATEQDLAMLQAACDAETPAVRQWYEGGDA